MTGRKREWRQRAASFFRQRALDNDLDAEMAAHLELAIDEHVARGLPLAEAKRQAMVAFGGVEVAKDLHRDARGLPFLDSVLQDVRYAVRTLRKTPGFTTVAVTMLALSIGANTAIFSLVSAVLLRPLPFAEPDRLVLLWEDFSAKGAPSRVEATPADYVSWKAQSRSFTDIAAFTTRAFNLTGSGEPEKVVGGRAAAGFFSILGTRPIIGRTLAAFDDAADATPAVVIGERLWHSRFNADPAIIGRSIDLSGLGHVVVGVVPDDFRFPDRNIALWISARYTNAELGDVGAYVFNVVARLAPGVTLAQAQAEMTTIGKRLAQERPRSNTDVGVSVSYLHEHLTRTARPALLILLGAVALVLLIAGANVANLLLARGAGRVKELTLRKAIGAGHGRVVRQLLTESAILAGAGVLAGVLLSTLVFAQLSPLVPSGLPAGLEPRLDLRVLAFTTLVTVVMVLVFGTGPALATRQMDGGQVLRGGTGRGTSGVASWRVRHALVIAELTLTVILLVAAGLLVRSYGNVLAADPGVRRPDQLLLAETTLSPTRYANHESRTAFYERVLERVKVLPGVTHAGYANYPPLIFKGGRVFLGIEGRPEPTKEEFNRHITSDRIVSPDYLTTLGVPLIRGRLFDERDGPDAPRTVLINQTLAARHWPNQDPIGQRVKIGTAAFANPWHTIIGVVGDVKQAALDLPAEPEAYFSLRQFPSNGSFFWPQYLVLRSDGDPMALANAVRAAVWEVDRSQPVSNVRSMAQVFDAEMQNRTTQMTLVTVFAFLGVIMASIGLYGVLAYLVAQRQTEIGVRMALGAQRATVVGAMVRDALVVAAVSVVLGLMGAAALSRFMKSLLYEIEPTDPATFAAVSFLALVMALVATYVPARRAAGIEPSLALRAE